MKAETANFTETFDTNTYKDATNTTGFWNTRDGNATVQNSGIYSWSWNSPTPQGRKLNDVAWASATVAVAVGDGGIIMRSTDSGATWSTTVPVTGVTKYTGVDFFDSNTGYIVGWPSKVLYTSDGGSTWTNCTNTGFNITYPNDVYFSYAATGYVVGEGGKMDKTVDSCANWSALTTGTTVQLNAVSSQKASWQNDVIAVGGGGTGEAVAIMSNNHGVTFDDITGTATNPLYDVFLTDYMASFVAGADGVYISSWHKGPLALAAGATGFTGEALSVYGFLNDNDTIIAVDSSGIVSTSIDQGANWSSVQTFSTDSYSMAGYGLAFQSTSLGLVVGESGMIAKTTDGAATWTDISSHVTDNILNSVVCPTNTDCYGVGFGYWLKSIDAGLLWSNTSSAIVENDVHFLNATTGIKVGGGTIEVTTNGGAAWTSKTSGTAGEYFYAVQMIDANTAFIAGSTGDDSGSPVVYKTTNCASTCSWTAETTTLTSPVKDIFFLDANTGYAVTNGGQVAKYVNGVWSWQIISANPLKTIYCYDANTCWAGTSTSGTTIYKTTNGIDWTTQTLNTADQVYKILGLDSKNLIVVGENYLQSTKDSGATWAAMTVTGAYPKGINSVAMISPVALIASGYSTANSQYGSLLNITSSYDTSSILQSTAVDSVENTITAATLTTTEALGGGSTLYYMSADGGSNWEAVTSGVEHSFTNTGSDLRWKSVVTAGISTPPVISTVTIDYTYAASGRRAVPPPPETPPVVYLCNDGLDNDGDGLIDFPNDLGCSSIMDNNESNTPACSDAIDNDSDGKIDYPLDPGCASSVDDNETDQAQCADGIDNDNDGKTDYPNDLGCTGLTDNDETNLPQCSDGIDNDVDGKIDYPNDLGCLSPTDIDETDPVLKITLPDGTMTNKKEPRIGGTTLAPNTNVDIYIDNKKVNTLISDANNSFEWKLATILAEGVHEVYAKVGTTQSEKMSFTVDTLPPEEPVMKDVVIGSQVLVNNKMETTIVVSGESPADVKYVMVYVDNEIVKIIKPTEVAWSLNISELLATGTHSLAVKAVDQANNFSDVVPEKSFSVTEQVFYQCDNKIDDDGDNLIDLADKGCANATDNNETDDALLIENKIALSGGAVSNNNMPQITGTTIAGAAQVEVYVDGVKISSLVSSADKKFSWTAPAALADGMHELAIKVGDKMSAPQMIFVDTELPVKPSFEPIKIPEQKIVEDKVITQLDMSGGLSVDVKYILIYLDDVLLDRFIPSGTNWQYKLAQEFETGTHKIAVKSMDEAGNLSVAQTEQDFVVEAVVIVKCNNNIDDDKDGVIDLLDPGCESKTDDSEDTDKFVDADEKLDIILETTSLLLNMEKGAEIGFEKDNEAHSLKILSTSILNQEFEILISSEPIRLRMRVGETKKVDIDGDDVLDLQVTLLRVLPNGQAVLTIKKINEKIVLPKPLDQEEIVVPIIDNQGDNNGQVDINLGGDAAGVAGAARAQALQEAVNQLLAAVGGNGGGAGGGGALPDQIDPALLNNPELQNKMKEIGEKKEWDKSDAERQLELIVGTEELVQSKPVQAAEELAANMIANVFGTDAKQTKAKIENGVRKTVKTTKQINQATLDNPVAEKVNDQTKTPAMATVTATSAASVATVGMTGTTGVNAVTYLQFALSQGLMLFVRKRKEKWGVVFNAVTKQPVDLAIVRIYNAVTNKLVGTKVTDKQGRYNFILKPGKYYLQVEKKDFRFPSKLLNEAKNDGKFENVYYGNEFEVGGEDAVVRSIALDPHKKVVAEKSLVRLYLVRKGQIVLTFAGPVVAIASFAINPQWWVGGTVVAQLGLYIIFKKLGIGDKPKSWGAVKELDTRANVSRAIVRVFDTKFNKLLETQVTDGKGRYAFLVGNQEYYMTAEKVGYFQKRTNPYNLTNEASGYLIDDLYLKKQKLDEKAIAAIESGAPVTIRTDLGRQTEKIIGGVQKVVRRDEEKFAGEVPEVDVNEMHEDFYALDTVK